MGRNHFSRHGGPCFINNGFSMHSENTPGHDHEDTKASNLVYSLLGLVCVLLPVCIAIVIAAVL